ncbi:MAG TPA: hypothetical protein VGH13_23025 [Xanthobacteraceae bacterium]|jgi:hypothetical protein
MPFFSSFGGSSNPSGGSSGGNIGPSTFSDLGAGVSDIFAGLADADKAKGAQFEEQNYQQAAQLALQNEEFTANSTAIKQAQSDRQLSMSLGATKAAVAGAGLAESGSALDVLRESAQEGATTHAVLGQQGLITEAGYAEQANSDENLAAAAQQTISADKTAETGAFIGAGMQAAAAIATL